MEDLFDVSSFQSTARRTDPPSSVNLTAFVRRFVMIWMTRVGSRMTTIGTLSEIIFSIFRSCIFIVNLE
jgi:hypothetical protein